LGGKCQRFSLMVKKEICKVLLQNIMSKMKDIMKCFFFFNIE